MSRLIFFAGRHALWFTRILGLWSSWAALRNIWKEKFSKRTRGKDTQRQITLWSLPRWTIWLKDSSPRGQLGWGKIIFRWTKQLLRIDSEPTDSLIRECPCSKATGTASLRSRSLSKIESNFPTWLLCLPGSTTIMRSRGRCWGALLTLEGGTRQPSRRGLGAITPLQARFLWTPCIREDWAPSNPLKRWKPPRESPSTSKRPWPLPSTFGTADRASTCATPSWLCQST